MTLLRFGTGWRDHYGRERSLVYTSDLAAVLWVHLNGDLELVRRGIADEQGLQARLLGWQDRVDDPAGPEWVIQQVCYWAPAAANPDCPVCQGEGYHAGPEGVAVVCGCGEVPF